MSSSVVVAGQSDGDSEPTVDHSDRVAPDESGGGAAGARLPPSKQSADQIDVVVSSLVQDMPDIQQHAIDRAGDDTSTVATDSAEPTKNTKTTESTPGDPRDKYGESFDAAKHRVRLDGSPMLTRRGNLYLIGNSGSKPRTDKTARSIVSPGGKAQIDPSAPHDPKPQQRAAGIAAANALIALGVGLGGSEWEPRVDSATGLDERSALESAFGDYFVATGLDDIPPGVALVIAVGCYTLPRFSQPQTKTRIKRVFGWVRTKILRRRAKKAAKTVLKAVNNTNAEPPA